MDFSHYAEVPQDSIDMAISKEENGSESAIV